MTQPPLPPAQPPYGGPQYAGPPPNHAQATTVLVLGILSVVVCQIVGPFAWVMGNRVVREIDASHGALGGRTEANVGRILGLVATVLIVVGLVFVVGILALGAVVSFSSSS
jgi:uncharacterized membrane protein YjgN (DUF898 family)